MKAKDLGDIGNVVAAVGVIISLLIVAWQIRLNTAAIRADSNLNMVTLASETLVWKDRDAAALLVRAEHGPDALDPVDTMRIQLYAIELFNVWEQGFLMQRGGLMADEQWLAWDDGMSSAAGRPPMPAIWTEIGKYYSASFQDHVSERYGRGDSASTP
jgi:hypothetical protein